MCENRALDILEDLGDSGGRKKFTMPAAEMEKDDHASLARMIAKRTAVDRPNPEQLK